MSELNFHDDGPCEVGGEEWERRLGLFMADETPMSWWWLSFVDTEQEYKPEGDFPGGPRWLGLCIVPGANIVMAAQFAHMLGCNPGGQVRGYPACPEGWQPKPEYIGRLFADAEGRAMGELELDEYCYEPS